MQQSEEIDRLVDEILAKASPQNQIFVRYGESIQDVAVGSERIPPAQLFGEDRYQDQGKISEIIKRLDALAVAGKIRVIYDSPPNKRFIKD